MLIVLILIVALILIDTDSYRLDSHRRRIHGGSDRRRIVMSASVYDNDTPRLSRARARLAEAQGIIPIGASEIPGFSLKEFKTIPSPSRVREISWRVAEPSVQYDPVSASSKLFAQPLKWITRNIQFTIPVAIFAIKIIIDVITDNEQVNRKIRAEELLDLLSAQSPALIKAGQALASRSDLLPKEYLDSLQKLQDRCPPYPTEMAEKLFESELGMKFDDVFDLEQREPVAAASIGQVYKGILRKNGAKVAIKVQRPNCEDAIAIDLYILRFYSGILQNILKYLKRDIDLVSVIDDFGEIIYREIDYRAEAVNAQRFAELYANIPNIFVPKVYTDLSTSKVLTMEWVDGCRLTDKESLTAMGLDSSKLVDTLVQCSLRQMLENGFFHADPHGGNLIAMPSGKVCYLDFGMVSYVEAAQRYSIIEAVVHLVNRDFVSLSELYKNMGFIPANVDTKPIVTALEEALPDVLNAPVGELNFKNVIGKLGDVMYKFPFSLPPFYIAIIRCLGVLEGLSIEIDKDFRIINDAYPYIASRLLTDPSTELQSALQQLLFKDGEPRWDRLQDLLEKAASTNDYDASLATDQLLAYLMSDQAKNIREILVQQTVNNIDQLGSDAVEYSIKLVSNLANPSGPGFSVFQQSDLNSFFDNLRDSILSSATPSPALINAEKFIRIFQSSSKNILDSEKLTAILRKVLREPVARETLAVIISQLSERAASRLVRRLFGTSNV